MLLFAPTDLFLYTDLSGRKIKVDGNSLQDRGTWQRTNSYQPGDVVLQQQALYVALRANSGVQPSAVVGLKWSALVHIGSVNPDSAYLLAVQAGSVAYRALWQGTDLSGTVVHTTVVQTVTNYQTLVTVWAGTQTANAAWAACNPS